MNSNKFILKINETTYFTILWQPLLYHYSPYINGVMYYHDQGHTMMIGIGEQDCFFVSLASHLQKACDNQLQLHPSIKSLGRDNSQIWILDREKAYKKFVFDSYISEGRNCKKWVGDKYYFSEVFGLEKAQLVYTWIYNNLSGDIIFEITPKYHWGSKKYRTEGQPPFKEFLKNYKPILQKVITKEEAQRLIVQANVCLAQYEASVKAEKELKEAIIKRSENRAQPDNGQKALDQSIAVVGQLRSRIGVEKKHFVQFMKGSNGKVHGYVEENFHALSDREKKALYDAGLVSDIKTGSIKNNEKIVK